MKSALAVVLHYVAAPALFLVAFLGAAVAVEGAWNLWEAARYFGWGVFEHSNPAGITFLSRVELGALACVVAYPFGAVFWRAYEPHSGAKTA